MRKYSIVMFAGGLLLACNVFLFSGSLIAQNATNDFVTSKPGSGGETVVYFDLKNIFSDVQIEALESILSGVPGVTSARIFYSSANTYRCEMSVTPEVSTGSIENIVASQGAEINLDAYTPEYRSKRVSGSVNQREKEKYRDPALPSHFPVFVDTGNPGTDNANFEKAKQDWILSYPDEVEQYTGRSYFEVTGIELYRKAE